MDNEEIVCELGKYTMDNSGLWHYEPNPGESIKGAIKDAIKSKPPVAAWFWFNDTPSPIFVEDSGETLYERWLNWREAIQNNNRALPLALLLSTRS